MSGREDGGSPADVLFSVTDRDTAEQEVQKQEGSATQSDDGKFYAPAHLVWGGKSDDWVTRTS